jgi:hypothetical protein
VSYLRSGVRKSRLMGQKWVVENAADFLCRN